MSLVQVWTHLRSQLNFSFFTPQFLQFVWSSNNKIHSKIKYLPHLSFENCEIKFIKFEFIKVRAFSTTPSNSNTQFSILILFNFHWENGSIINSFHTLIPNSLKPSWCTFSRHQKCFEDTMSTTTWSVVCGLGDLNIKKRFKNIMSAAWNAVAWEIST